MKRHSGHLSNCKEMILLFDPDGEDYLKKMVLSGIYYRVFDPRTDVGYKWTRVLRAIYRTVKFYRGRILSIFVSVDAVKWFLRRCRVAVIAEQIREINPKGVISFIDNSEMFHMVCEHCEEIPFIAIQNGGRYVWCARDARSDPEMIYHIDEYFCFGPQVKRLFERHGHDIKRYVTCGSLVGGYFFSSCPESNAQETPIYDICLVSQWMAHFSDINRIPQGWERLNEAIIRVTELVARFAREQRVKVCIALRRNDPAERDFYNSHFQGRCVFQDRDRQNFSSYKAVAASKLSIALNSTLLSEAFGAGRKVLFVNPFHEERLIPIESVGPWNLSTPDYEGFRERVNELLTMDMEAYLSAASAAMEDSMSFHRDRPAHVIIRERLLELTGHGGRQSSDACEYKES